MLKTLTLQAMALVLSCAACAQKRSTQMPTPPQLTLWTDPTEHAFSLKVPTNWRLTGGTHRNSAIDARNYVRTESPDGKIKVWIDDPNVLPRQAPHPAYYRLGWYDGRVVQSPAGPLQIERFQSGAQFAHEYTVKSLCGAPQSVSTFELPLESRRMNASVASAAARARVHAMASAGEFVYRCGDRSVTPIL